MSIADKANQLYNLASSVPAQSAGWIDNELEELFQQALALIGEGHPLRIELGTAFVARQQQAQALRDSLQALTIEIQGMANGLT